MGWVIAGVGTVLIIDFVWLLGVSASCSALDAFNQEADDREQIESIREYNRRKQVKKSRRTEKRVSRKCGDGV